MAPAHPTVEQSCPERSSGLVNARDAGAAVGLRPGLLLRSDAPLPGDPPPPGLVWPPGTVVDLRSDRERGDGSHPLAGPGVHVEHLPLNDGLAPDAQQRMDDGTLTLPRLYLDLLDAAPHWLPTLVHLAGAGAPPLLVHCAAGKDRTGVTVAVLLAAAGASPDAIVADYLRTNDVVPTLVERMRTEHPHRPVVREELTSAPLEAITGALARFGADAGAWCREQGAAAADLDRWRQRARPPA